MMLSRELEIRTVIYGLPARAKIGEFYMALVVDQDVLGLKVEIEDAPLVKVLQC